MDNNKNDITRHRRIVCVRMKHEIHGHLLDIVEMPENKDRSVSALMERLATNHVKAVLRAQNKNTKKS